MASVPQRQPSSRQSPPQRSTSIQEPQVERANSLAPSTSSVDSQTLFLNDPKNIPTSERIEDQTERQGSSEQPDQALGDDGSEPRKCWICFSDETEDTTTSGPWRTPCPCALTAHEPCLLDWIADMEAPDASRSTAAPKKLQCPQCKSEIHLARPRSWIVQGMSVVEKVKSKALLPTVLLGMGYGVLICFSHHGAHTIRMIFGDEDAETILAPAVRPTWIEHQMQWFYPTLSSGIFRNWRGPRVELGLPLIPTALIASRTSFADYMLPILPLIFFATHEEASKTLSSNQYPPSAALTLAILPYLRGLYCEYLERVWGARERAWVKEVQPRLGNEETGNNDVHHHMHNHDNDDVVEVEFGLDLDIDAGDEGPNRQNDQVPDHDTAPPNVLQQDVSSGNEPPVGADRVPRNEVDASERDAFVELPETEAIQGSNQQPQAQAQEQQRPDQQGAQPQEIHRHENNILISGTRVADTIVGALLFPSIAAGSGEALRLLLPTSWTVPGYWRGRPVATGLLQTRWGRSVIGGCLFVVLKDALRIYCRWRMAQAFRKRKVLNYDKKTGKTVEPEL